jgi:hypothetical protein
LLPLGWHGSARLQPFGLQFGAELIGLCPAHHTLGIDRDSADCAKTADDRDDGRHKRLDASAANKRLPAQGRCAAGTDRYGERENQD